MTRERAKELLPVIQAWADGKEIQFQSSSKGPWCTIQLPYVPAWVDYYNYRIKPEPKFRPWKPEEVPLNAWFRNLNGGSIFFRIEEFDSRTGRCVSSRDHVHDLKSLSEFKEHSTDGGKTWKTCGVEEAV